MLVELQPLTSPCSPRPLSPPLLPSPPEGGPGSGTRDPLIPLTASGMPHTRSRIRQGSPGTWQWRGVPGAPARNTAGLTPSGSRFITATAWEGPHTRSRIWAEGNRGGGGGGGCGAGR